MVSKKSCFDALTTVCFKKVGFNVQPSLNHDDLYSAARIADPVSVEEAIYEDALRPSTYEAATTKDILPTLTQLTDEEKELIGRMFDRFDDYCTCRALVVRILARFVL